MTEYSNTGGCVRIAGPDDKEILELGEATNALFAGKETDTVMSVCCSVLIKCILEGHTDFEELVLNIAGGCKAAREFLAQQQASGSPPRAN